MNRGCLASSCASAALAFMGSVSMFALVLCDCGATIPRMEPQLLHCYNCAYQAIASCIRAVGRYAAFSRVCGFLFINRIASYLVPDYKSRQRKWYLRCLLMAEESPFGQFTYFRNGRSGNISKTEDIIDRILSYLLHADVTRLSWNLFLIMRVQFQYAGCHWQPASNPPNPAPLARQYRDATTDSQGHILIINICFQYLNTYLHAF